MPRVTLLLIDDDAQARSRFARVLVADGFRVVEADGAEEGILLARRCRPALTLLGLRPDGASGRDVVDYLVEVLGLPFLTIGSDPGPVPPHALDRVCRQADPAKIRTAVAGAMRAVGLVSPAT